jgi:hypothetical protein
MGAWPIQQGADYEAPQITSRPQYRAPIGSIDEGLEHAEARAPRQLWNIYVQFTREQEPKPDDGITVISNDYSQFPHLLDD